MSILDDNLENSITKILEVHPSRLEANGFEHNVVKGFNAWSIKKVSRRFIFWKKVEVIEVMEDPTYKSLLNKGLSNATITAHFEDNIHFEPWRIRYYKNGSKKAVVWFTTIGELNDLCIKYVKHPIL